MTGINISIKSITDETISQYGILFAEINGAYIAQVINEKLDVQWDIIKSEKDLCVEKLTAYLNSLGDVIDVRPHPSDDFVIESIQNLKI